MWRYMRLILNQLAGVERRLQRQFVYTSGVVTRTDMAQRSVLTQTTQPKEDQTTFRYRWMHRFFTIDVSPDNHPIVELQRRAIWISIALILQAGNEISHDLYMPYLGPFGSLIPFALIAGSFIAISIAFRPTILNRSILQ